MHFYASIHLLRMRARPAVAAPRPSEIVQPPAAGAPLTVSLQTYLRSERRYRYGLAAVFSAMLAVLVVIGTLLWA